MDGFAGDAAGGGAGCSDALTGLRSAAHAGWAAENRGAAQRLIACYELFRECVRREERSGAVDDCRPGYAVVDGLDVAVGYVVSAMGISSRRAESMISFAWDLHQRFPAILAAMAAGRMEQRVAEMLARQLESVHVDVLERVQREVVDDFLAAFESGVRLGDKAVRENADAIISRHDPDAIRRRREEASRARGVRFTKGVDGMSRLSAILATEEAAVLAEAIDRRVAEHERSEAEAAAEARAAEAAEESAVSSGSVEETCHYSEAERRADALMSLVCGDAPAPAGAAGAAEGGSGQVRAPLRPKVTVITTNGAGDGGVGLGGARVEFTRTGEAALQALLDMLATSDGASFEKVDPRIGAADDARGALKYRPSAELARRIRLRDGTCRHPGCVVPAESCDLDHVRPFDHSDPARGGRTEEGNLMCLCRRHHRFKTFADWTYDLQPDGTVVVTSPEGSIMVTRPAGPLGEYRREQARTEADAWGRQQRRNPDPVTDPGRDRAEPTSWSRRAARRRAAQRRAGRAHAEAGTSPGATERAARSSRWWQRNQPTGSVVERDIHALLLEHLDEVLDDILSPPPF